MSRFLKENWGWIVVPMALVLGLLCLFLWMTSGDEPAPFDYPIFG